VTKKKFMNHSFSSHPKPPTSLVLLHKTKEHSSSCCHFAIVVEIKELHDWNLASNLKPHEPWVQSTLVHGTRLYYKMSFHSICHKQGHETRKDIFFVFVHMVEFMFEHVLLWLSKIFFGCSNFHVCNYTLIIRRLQKKKSHGKMTTCKHFIHAFTMIITINFEFNMIFSFVTILKFASKMTGMRMASWEVLLITDDK
jgi:ssDNA-binding Zn-finger/Zn-ribbon topoisomerase 1